MRGVYRMKRGAALLGLSIGALAVGYITTLYRSDEAFRGNIDQAVVSIKEIVNTIKDRVIIEKQKVAERNINDTKRNQEWVDEQWEVLGI